LQKFIVLTDPVLGEKGPRWLTMGAGKVPRILLGAASERIVVIGSSWGRGIGTTFQPIIGITSFAAVASLSGGA